MVASTGFSGLFDTIQPTGHATLGSVAYHKQMSKLLRKNGSRALNELMLELNGVAAGAAALKQYSRIAHTEDPGNPASQGGARTIEVVDVVNRVTATADETVVDNILNETFAPTTYIEDASGNGGGGKLLEQQDL